MKRFFKFIFGKDKEPEPEPKPSIESEPEVIAPVEPKEEKPKHQKAIPDVVERLTSKKKKSRKFNYHEGCMCPNYKVPESARKKLPKLRQVELARPTQTSFFGEEPLMPIERMKIKKGTSEEKKCPDSCSKRMHKLAAPRQNWREVKKRQIEEGNKIFTVSKFALRAVASPRIIELAKPKRIRKKIIKYKKIKKRYLYVPVIPKKKRKKKPEEKKELVKKPSLLHAIEEFGRDMLKPPPALTSDYSRRMDYVLLPDFPFGGIEVKAHETDTAEEEPKKRPSLADILEDIDKTELLPPSPVDSVFKRRKSYILLPDFPFEGIQLKQEESEEEETKNLQISLADIIADIDQKELEPPVALESEFPRRRSYVLLPDFPFEGIEDTESEGVEPKRRPSLADVIEETDLKEFSPPPPFDSEYVRRKSYVLLPEFPFEGIEYPKTEEHIEDTEFDNDDNKIDEEKAIQEYLQVCVAFEDFSKSDKAIKKETSLSPHPDTTALQETDEKECNLDESKQNDSFIPYPEIHTISQETDVKEDNQNIVEQDHTLTSSSEIDTVQNIEAGTCEDIMTPDSLLIPDSETSVVVKTENNICNIEDTVKNNNETTYPTNAIPEDVGNISEIENSFQENVMLSSVSEPNKGETPIMVKTDFREEPQHMSPEIPDVVTNLKVNVLVDHLKQTPVSQPDKNKTTVADNLAETEPLDKDETVVADHLTKSEPPDSQPDKNETIVANHFTEKEPPVCQSDKDETVVADHLTESKPSDSQPDKNETIVANHFTEKESPVCQSDKDETVVADHLTESKPSDSQPDKNKTIVADHLTETESHASETDGKNVIFIDQFTELKPPSSESNKNENDFEDYVKKQPVSESDKNENDFEDYVKDQPVSEPNKTETLETSNINPTGVEEVDDFNQKLVTNLESNMLTDKKEEENAKVTICAFCKQEVSPVDNKCLCLPYIETEKIEEDTEGTFCGLKWLFENLIE